MRVVLILLLVALILFLILCFLLKPVKPENSKIENFYHRNFAHRGLHTKDKKIPENSIAAFQRAVDHGYGIELDIQFSKDKQVIVFHDDTLDRVCHVSGRVDDYTYDQLKEMKLCKQDHHIPLFKDVLKVVDGKIPLIVELKTGPHNEELCKKAYEMLSNYKGSYCIESFDPHIVAWFYKNAPHILRGQLSAPSSHLKKEIDSRSAFFLGNCLTNFMSRPNFIAYDKLPMPWTVKLAYYLGAMRFVWTVRDTDDIELIESKNDAVIFEHYEPTVHFD